MTDTPHRASFDPTCTYWASFAELRVGDRIDYWGAARPVVEHTDFGDGRVRIVVDNENGGRDLALAPGTEGTWRDTRAEETPRCPAAHPQDPTPCDGPPAVTVLDARNAGADGCELHAARLLALLEGGRVYPLPHADENAAIRVFRAASETRERGEHR